MPTYGSIKVNTLTFDVSGSATDLPISTIATDSDVALKADINSPTFTGSPTVPGYAALSGATFTGQINATDIVCSNNLTVNGTQTILNTETLQVEDKEIDLGKVSSPSNASASGGGIKLLGGSDGDKTITWLSSNNAWNFSEHIHLGDNKKLLVGDGSDLELWHSGSHSYVSDVGTGDLVITSNGTGIQLAKHDPWELMLKAIPDGSVELYEAGTKRFETSATGCTVTGTLAATAVTGDGSGLTNLPPGGNTFTALAHGSIANNKAVQIRTDGKVEQIASSYSARTTWSGSNTEQIATDSGSKECTNVWVGGSHRLIVNVWQDTNGNIKARSYKYDSSYGKTNGTAQTIVSGNTSDVTVSYDPVEDRILFTYIENVSGNYQLRATVATPDGTNTNLTSIQSAVTIESASGNSNASPSVFYETTSQKHIIIYRTNPSGGAPGANWDCKYRVMSLSGNTLTTNSSNTFDADDSTRFNFCRTGANTIAVAYRAGDGTGYVKAGTIGSTTITWGSRVDFTAGGSAQISYGNRGTIGCAFDIGNSKLCIVYVSATGKRPRAVYSSISTNTVTIENAGNNQDISIGSSGVNGSDDTWVHAIYEPIGGKIWTIMNQYWGAYSNSIITGKRIDYTSNGNFTQQGYSAIDLGQWQQDVSWNCAVGEDGNIFPTGLDQSNNQYHYYYRAYLLQETSNLVGNDLYVGFADQAYTNGQTATILTYGNSVNTLSGMTPGSKYYVQGDGTVGTSAATPTTRAGIAIGTTKLLIQEPTNWGG